MVFCSTKKEARELAKKFNKKRHPTIALTGEDKQEVREDAIDRLTNDEREDRLEYIITVDNEGVNIPEVNQVLLVRPTQSSIIFIQQLGRGLRKTKIKNT
ncbi:helicase-related protein [Methanosphaera sp. Vir-13MRS]|uniref:helicase-related protein n=1 Tax=Candidatus Methanosphaera massiliense TaxID=3017187 RepID=UPI002380695B|nr:helicase-related protein [Candidatus Methanosphaera massiliense]MDE4078685.1 helicase-related protein [Candidatus Methanosphaera massiliense]